MSIQVYFGDLHGDCPDWGDLEQNVLIPVDTVSCASERHVCQCMLTDLGKKFLDTESLTQEGLRG